MLAMPENTSGTVHHGITPITAAIKIQYGKSTSLNDHLMSGGGQFSNRGRRQPVLADLAAGVFDGAAVLRMSLIR